MTPVEQEGQGEVNEAAQAEHVVEEAQTSAPVEARAEEVKEAAASKQLDATTPETAKAGTPDIDVFGDPNAWITLSKASSKKQGWMKSTKAMFCGTGALVQVSTHQSGGGPNNSQAVAEAITYVPDVVIEEVVGKDGKVQFRRLVPRPQAAGLTHKIVAPKTVAEVESTVTPIKRTPWGTKKKVTKVAKKKSPWAKKKVYGKKAASQKKVKRRPWGSVTRGGKPVGKGRRA